MRRLFFVLVLVFCCSAASYGFWLKSVIERFSPVEARIISVEGRKVYLDAGRDKGVKKYDIFYAYKPVKTLKTATGKPLVIWSNPIAEIEITYVDKDYSVGILKKGEKVAPGWKVVRFENVPACFVGEGDKSDTVEKMLKINLSYLDWKKDCSTARLVFRYTKKGYLDVVNDSKMEIAFIPVFEVDFPQPVKEAPKKKKYTKGGSTIYMENYRDVASLPVYVLSADFGTVEGEEGVKIPAVVYTNGSSIFFALIVDYEAKVLSRYDYKGMGDIIHVSAGDPDKDGNMEIIATTYEMDKGARSFILRVDEKGKMKLVKKDIYYLLTMIDADLDGTKDTILGTRFDEDELFDKTLYIMKLEKNKLKKVDKLNVPDVFKLYACYYGDVDGDKDKELVFTTDTHKLAVYKNGDLWLSSESVGGGYNYVRITKGTPSFSYEEGITIDPDLVVFKLGKQVKVLAVKNKSRHKFIAGNIPWYKGSEIMELIEEFYGYSLVPISEEIDGVVQAAGIVGKELWCIMNVEPPFKRNARSYIIAFPIPDLER